MRPQSEKGPNCFTDTNFIEKLTILLQRLLWENDPSQIDDTGRLDNTISITFIFNHVIGNEVDPVCVYRWFLGAPVNMD